jgi:hypothetical protein
LFAHFTQSEVSSILFALIGSPFRSILTVPLRYGVATKAALGRPGIAGQRTFVLSARVIFLLYWEIYVAKRSAKRREWTTQDVRELRKLAKHKTPTAKIARALKRTEGATRQKAFSLGVSLDTRT